MSHSVFEHPLNVKGELFLFGVLYIPQFLSSRPLGQSLIPSQMGTQRPFTVHRNCPGQAIKHTNTHRAQNYAEKRSQNDIPILSSAFHGCQFQHPQLTIWQVEDAVLQLKARPCEWHLRCHKDSGCHREQEETFAVGLQSSGATQSEKGEGGWNWREVSLKASLLHLYKQLLICLFLIK